MRSLTQSCLYNLKASKRLSSRQVRLQNHQKLPAYSQTATSSLDKYIWNLERPLFLDYSRFAWFTVKMIHIYFIVLRAWAKEDNWTWFIKASLRSLPRCFNGCSRFASGDLNSSHDEVGQGLTVVSSLTYTYFHTLVYVMMWIGSNGRWTGSFTALF